MATDSTKKKLNSLRESISKLETQLVLSKGDKTKTDVIQRLITRFNSDISKLKNQ